MSKRDFVLVTLISIFPWSALLLEPYAVYFADWSNHLWMIGYLGKQLVSHGSITPVLNTDSAIGLPFPVFYAPLLYPLLGAFSGLLSPQIAVRVAIVFLSVLLGFSVYKTTSQKEAMRKFRLLLVLLVTWTVYPLVNIYYRGAVAEYFATTLLTISVCSLVSFLRFPSWRNMAYLCVLVSLMIGSHAITAFYGTCFLIAFTFIFIWFEKITTPINELLLKVLVGTLFVILVSAPWLYAVVTFQKFLSISQSLHQGLAFHQVLDSFWGRFIPLSLNPQDYYGTDGVPSFTAPLNFPLLLLAVVLWFRKRTKSQLAQASLLVMIGALIVASVSPSVVQALGLSKIFDRFQFSYRLVTYINLLTLCFFFTIKISFEKEIRPSLKAFLVGISLFGVLSAFVTAYRSNLQSEQLSLPNFRTSEISVALRSEFYGVNDYSTVSLYPTVAKKVREISFSVNTDSKFGTTNPLTTTVKQPEVLQTNVYPFPWNQITVDGIPISKENLAVSAGRLAIRLQNAGNYDLSYSFSPPKHWTFFRSLSFLLWALALLGAHFLPDASPQKRP